MLHPWNSSNCMFQELFCTWNGYLKAFLRVMKAKTYCCVIKLQCLTWCHIQIQIQNSNSKEFVSDGLHLVIKSPPKLAHVIWESNNMAECLELISEDCFLFVTFQVDIHLPTWEVVACCCTQMLLREHPWSQCPSIVLILHFTLQVSCEIWKYCCKSLALTLL